MIKYVHLELLYEPGFMSFPTYEPGFKSFPTLKL